MSQPEAPVQVPFDRVRNNNMFLSLLNKANAAVNASSSTINKHRTYKVWDSVFKEKTYCLTDKTKFSQHYIFVHLIFVLEGCYEN